MTDKEKPNRSGQGKGQFPFRRLIAYLLLATLSATILFLFFLIPPVKASPGLVLPSQEPDQASPRPLSATATPEPEVSGSHTPPTTAIPLQHTLYIIIDDAGNNLASAQRYLAFPGKLTFAVLPGLPHSREVARLVRQHGQGLILHQPMEAIGGQNPGPGLIRHGMEPEAVIRQLSANLDELETPDGINNHMGSKGTQDRSLLEPIMRVLKGRQLFFLDSRTSAKSKAIEVAHFIGVPSVERDVFLDNDPDPQAMLQALQEGTKIAEKRGYAIMIGHAWSVELAQVLIDTYPHLVEQGYDFDSLVNYFLGGKGFVEGSADTRSRNRGDREE